MPEARIGSTTVHVATGQQSTRDSLHDDRTVDTVRVWGHSPIVVRCETEYSAGAIGSRSSTPRSISLFDLEAVCIDSFRSAHARLESSCLQPQR
jgi:hypothetical protein